MKKENQYQASLKKKIEKLLPGCVIQKGDCGSMQGIPDLLILYGPRWGSLEVKRSQNAKHRPNQDYRVQKFDEMSFSRFIYPENEQEVLHELQQALQP